jgi:two-component system NtrC family sensor kinase
MDRARKGGVSMKHSYPAARRQIDDGGRSTNGRPGEDAAPGNDVFRILAEKSSDLIAQVRLVPEFRVVYVNPSILRITGHTREECYEDSDLLIAGIHPEDAGRFRYLLDPATPNDPEPIVLRGTGKDGATVWVELTRTVVRDLSAGTVDAYFIGRDVTRRRRAREVLKESQKFVSSLLENAPHATVVVNPDTSIRYVNPIWEEINGWRLDEVIGMSAPYPWWPEEQRETFVKNFKAALEQGAGKAEVVSVKKNGERYWMALSWTSVREGGKIQYTIINSLDITEQKEMELKLQEHKCLIEGILSSLPEGVLVTDFQGRIVLANEAFHRIFHLTKKAVKTRTFPELLRIEDLNKLTNSVRQGRAARNTLDFRYRTAGREKIITCRAVKMDAKTMLLIFSDVSQEREDKERLYLTDRLASIGEMAAGLAHELNNPLTAILTLSQLLLHHGLSGEDREDMKCIYEEAQRATRIVKNVLLFTRNHNYEHGQSHVNDVVRDVLRLRQYDEKASHITVITNLAEDLPEIPIDRFQLQQVFLNIILNAEAAVRDTGRDGVLTVTTEKTDGGVRIHFTDNGCGIKKKILARIFDPFFTTKEIGKGTGLGLSICYGIVVKNGGSISVRSRAGQGATFTIEMPGVPT